MKEKVFRSADLENLFRFSFDCPANEQAHIRNTFRAVRNNESSFGFRGRTRNRNMP